MKTFLFNPYTGTPRHQLDIQSDPEGLLIVEPDAPVRPAIDCAGKDPSGCWNVRCQLSKTCVRKNMEKPTIG